VREALIAAGVPEARVLSVRADVAVEPGDAEAQRRVLVEVVDAEVPR
jgi:hypothetical protein